MDWAFELLPVELAVEPSPPAVGPDLLSPAMAVLPVPPYALAPAPVFPSPSLTPADAGAPSGLLPYAPPTPTAPAFGPSPLLLCPRDVLLPLPYALERAPPLALVGSAREVPVKWMTPRAETPAITAALRAARIAAVGFLWKGPRRTGPPPGS